jgi:predicted nucleic acid-binding protein
LSVLADTLLACSTPTWLIWTRSRRWLRRRTLSYRSRSELPFSPMAVEPSATIMLDTTVYLDELVARRLPSAIRELVDMQETLHASVACAEIAVAIGHLDPAHPLTPVNRSKLEHVLRQIDPEEVVAPSPAAWTEAAVIAGILARTQGYPKDARRDLLLDALIFLTAREAGAVLLSRNVRHMDLLLRFRPDAQVLLYERA